MVGGWRWLLPSSWVIVWVVALFTEKEYTEESHDCKKRGVLGLGHSKSEGAVGHQGVRVLQATGCRCSVL